MKIKVFLTEQFAVWYYGQIHAKHAANLDVPKHIKVHDLQAKRGKICNFDGLILFRRATTHTWRQLED